MGYMKDFEEEVKKFQEDPDADDDEDEKDKTKDGDMGSDDDSGDESGAVPDANAFKKSKSKSKSTTPGDDDDDDESDDSYWDSDSDESSSSSGEDQPGMSLREKFLKKSGSGGKGESGEGNDRETRKAMKDEKSKKKIKGKHHTIDEEDEDDDEDDDWVKVDRGAADKPKMFEKDAEINHQLVIQKLKEIMAARGKKRTNRKEQIDLLHELYNIAEEHNLGIGISAKIKLAIISSIFDYNPKISAAIKPEYWEKCMPEVEHLLKIVSEHEKDLIIGDGINDDSEQFETAPYRIRGCYLAVVERMNEEFHKVLKGCDAHSNEYVARLRDEDRVMEILEKAQKLLEKTKNSSEMCRIYLQRIDHIYFKFDPRVIQQKKKEIPA